ncbi:MAG: YidC/Oxa1 family membrane protein insertase [Roseburia sp.]|nr:YidC/Oxa1 family membrane protein insertase [Roseburia sp.]
MLLTAYDGMFLGPIAKILGWLMNGIYYLMSLLHIENVGLSIILFTIVIYIVLFPFTYKQQKFSKLQQKMQPELNAINKKYHGKKDQASMMAMQEETQAVYEKYGVSMMGSCVQMLIQMPLLFALYRVFMNVPAYVTGVKNNFSVLVDEIMATGGYQEKMTQLVTDLRILTQPAADFTVTDSTAISNSIVDVLYKLNSTGWDTLKETFPQLSDSISTTFAKVSDVNNFLWLNISDTPWQIIRTNFESRSYLLVFLALMIPVLSYVSQVVNMKLIPQNSNTGNEQSDNMARQMNMMNKTMPLFSLVMCFSVPVGLGIYWIAGAVVRSVQQFFLNRHFEKVDLEDIIKKNQEKMKKKREKMGIAENQISNAARMNTRQMVDAKKKQLTSAEKEEEIQKANAARSKAKANSMSAKANLVREFNERNNKKQGGRL